MATIRKRTWQAGGKKRIAWLVDFRDKLGRRRAKQFATRAEAQAWADKTDMSGVLSVDVRTVGHACHAWLERAYSQDLEPTTVLDYKSVVERHLIPYIGNIELKKLSSGHVITFRNELANEKSQATATRAVRFLKMVLNLALDEDWVGRNVARKLKSSKSARMMKSNRVNRSIPTLEEQRMILKACDRHTGGGSPKMRNRSRALFEFLMETAARPSEARGLRWSDVKFDTCEVSIAQRADRFNVLGPLKTVAAYRDIPITQHHAATLRSWRENCPPSEEDLVFPTVTGKPISARNFNREFVVLQRAAGLTLPGTKGKTRYVPYDLRHAGASRWIHDRVDLKTLTTRLGHSSAQVTLDIYGHVIQNAARTQAGRLAAERDLYGDAAASQHDDPSPDLRN